jgi:hypothetical protein
MQMDENFHEGSIYGKIFAIARHVLTAIPRRDR